MYRGREGGGQGQGKVERWGERSRKEGGTDRERRRGRGRLGGREQERVVILGFNDLGSSLCFMKRPKTANIKLLFS